MAIKISGSTVIDNSRNITNVDGVTANTFTGSASGLTDIPVDALPIYPLTPTNSSPANGATNVNPASDSFTASAYSHLFSKTMACSEWQASTSSGFGTLSYCNVQAGTSVSHTPADNACFTNSTEYYWRVRYFDSDAAPSGFSTGTSFTTAATYAPTVLGAADFGGYYIGFHCSYYLIVAPNASGCSCCEWKTSNNDTPGTNTNDGYNNTYNVLTSSHPAAEWAAGLSIGGYNDWFLPSSGETQCLFQCRACLPAGEGIVRDSPPGYWTSTDYNGPSQEGAFAFDGGDYGDITNRTSARRVRAMRRFQ